MRLFAKRTRFRDDYGARQDIIARNLPLSQQQCIALYPVSGYAFRRAHNDMQ